MSKTKIFYVWQILLACMLAGCDISTFKPTPAELPPYTHYKPTKLSNVHLEFDYPGDWIYFEKREWMRIAFISLEDHRSETLPTPSPPDYHPAPNDYGYIRIWIREGKPGQTPETEVEMLMQAYSRNTYRYTVLDEFETTIDGYKASVLEYYDKEPMENYFALRFNRKTFFMINNHMYEISFSITDSERGSEFEQGYEYFINSVKIIPQ